MNSRSRWVFTVLGGFIAAALIALTVILCLGPKPSRTVIPNPNGYDDLLQAGQCVTGDLNGISELSRDQLKALTTTNGEALRLLRVGLGRDCRVPTEAQITNFANISSDLIDLKSLAKLLSAEGALAEMESRPGDAARSYVDSIRLGNAMSRGGLMINRAVGIACEGMGERSLVRLMPKLGCEELPPLIDALVKADRTTVPWEEVLQNENRYVRAEAGKSPNPFKYVTGVFEARNMRNAVAERHSLAAAHLRLLYVELALRAYKCKAGHGPATLTQLAPEYMQSLPVDPFNGQPFVYRSTGTNWMLYSVGPDRLDDGGKPVNRTRWEAGIFFPGASPQGKEKRKGDLLYDSEW